VQPAKGIATDDLVVSPELRGMLRRTSLWPSLHNLHGNIARPVCAGVHALVVRAGAGRLPHDLVLKHTYDYQLVYLDPELIQRSLRIGEWARHPAGFPGRIAQTRSWLRLGGGWKHLRRHVSRNVHGQFVAPGDWDLQAEPFKARRTITELFVDGLPPEETLEYRKLRASVAAGDFGRSRGCRTLTDVDRYFDELHALYDTLRTEGYRTQLELGNDGTDEIRVCIDREGRPCVFGGGTHRLSIAKLIGLTPVPVVVKRVHATWVTACMAAYGTDDVHVAIASGLHALQGHPREQAT
jgi:hypothetical protein